MTVQAFQYRDKPTVKSVEVMNVVSDERVPGPIPETSNTSMNITRTSNQEKYMYQYGIKNIELKKSFYNQAGVMVTKPIEVEGNIIEVSLESIEEHPLFDELKGMATDRFTSVEYYISLHENPSLSDWIPILPTGKEYVKSERLFFKGSHAELLFHARIDQDEETQVYKNGLKLSKDDWYFTNRGASIQLAIPYENDSIYTIDYVPNIQFADPYVVKVNEQVSKRVRMIENFPNGTDYNNTIKLSKYPFIDYKEINRTTDNDPNQSAYKPIEVFLKKGTIAIGDNQYKKEFFPEHYTNDGMYCTKNRTDYQNKKDVFLKRYDLSEDELYTCFEYKQEKDKLIFTESFNRTELYDNQVRHHGNAEVEVRYDYLVTNFRLKIILRKNCGDELIVTPSVNKCMLNFKVMK